MRRCFYHHSVHGLQVRPLLYRAASSATVSSIADVSMLNSIMAARSKLRFSDPSDPHLPHLRGRHCTGRHLAQDVPLDSGSGPREHEGKRWCYFIERW